jgi:PAS domain S-box-containing protein
MSEPLDRAELEARLAEAEETLRAIRHGEVDALLVTDETGERVYTLRSADAPYRALVERMQEGAATVSRDGAIIYANLRFAELAGVPLERVIGTTLEETVDLGDWATLDALIQRGDGSLRTRLKSPGRPARDVQISVSRVSVDGVDHRTLIVTDLSTLTRVQRESQSKDEFLAMLAHELRNPLGAIGGAVEVLGLAEIAEPRAVQARDVIQRQTAHMARLVDDLLDVGRVVTGKIVLDLRPVDLAESVRSSVAAMATDARVHGRIQVTAEPAWVSADAVRLEQIVGNLVTNALKFSPADRPVRVAVRPDGAETVLAVTDEGAGIERKLLPRIFDLFVQADATPDRSQGGLGIGLTLVRRLVELHGGTVEAQSEGKGLGSTFTVRLPSAAAPARPKAGAPKSSAGGAAKRVLMVDDNDDLREMFAVVLTSAGHEVSEVTDGPAAVAAFEAGHFDAAVIDIGLPGMDGSEVARAIRSRPAGQEVALIALTGYGLPEDRERSRQGGFDRHLVKPVVPSELRKEIAAITAHPRDR